MAQKKNDRPVTAVFAYSEVGYACLDELLRKGANVAVVLTHEDDPNENIWFRSVKGLALSRGIPVRTNMNVTADVISLLRDIGAELIFSFYYRAVIPVEILKIPRLGAYNVHGSLLPRYRGRACVNWAVLNGETETGATLHVMSEFADRGDIVDREKVAILHEDTSLDVFLKVAAAARAIVARSLEAIEAGNVRLEPQDEAQATKFGRRTPADGLIDWNKKSEEIYNMVRALTHPFPGAFTETGGKKMYIWKARAVPGNADPGTPLPQFPPAFGTGDGLLEVLSCQIDGEPERSFVE